MMFEAGDTRPWRDSRNLTVRHRRGGLMGSSEEPVVFAKVMGGPMRSWIESGSANEADTHLRCGIYNSICCGATTVYADGIFDKTSIDDVAQTTIDEKLKRSNTVLDE
eukprot:1137653-Pyramimonas_sp.AAC.1